jgi:probable HAF family extracellular repeat protein
MRRLRRLVPPALAALLIVSGLLAARAVEGPPEAAPAYDVVVLDALGGETSRAYGVNDRGWVVGHADDAAGRRTVVMWRDGRVIDLGTLGGDEATALAVNDHGQVAGHSTTTSGQELGGPGSRAFLWEDGRMTDLGTGGEWSWAFAINDAGEVVGQAGGIGAVRWRGGAATALAGRIPLGSGWDDLVIARAINARGQIVGWGQRDEVTCAFLLTPGSPDATPVAGLPVAQQRPLPECSYLEDRQLPPLAGELAVAQRVFEPSALADSGLVHFNPNVAEYETVELAAAAFPVLIDRIRSSPLGTERKGVGTHILDENIVFGGTVSPEGRTLPTAEVLVRDGRYIHAWYASAVDSDPLSPMFDVIRRLLRQRTLPVASAVPLAAADLPLLFALLPDADDAPDPLELVREGCGVRRNTDRNLATPVVGEAGSRSGPPAFSAENLGAAWPLAWDEAPILSEDLPVYRVWLRRYGSLLAPWELDSCLTDAR